MSAGKIERIELFHVEVPLPTALFPVWIPGYPQYRQRYTLLVVTTRDGLQGYATGPAFDREREGLGELVGQFLVGLDATDLDVVRERLRQASFLGWRNHWMDVAFWDLAGKIRGVPVHQLMAEALGGPVDAAAPESVPAYASFQELRPARARAEAVERAQRAGFKAAKIPVHSIDEAEDHEQLRLARQVAGPGFELMVHAHQAWSVSLVQEVPRWDLERARRIAEVAGELKLAWLQEPLHEELWDDLVALGEAAPVPLAGGDLASDLPLLRALVRHRCYRVLTPDATFAGLGTLVHAMRACRERGVAFSPSSKGDGLGLAANLHALVAWTRAVGARGDALLEVPWEPPALVPEHRDLLLAEPFWVREDGSVAVPTGPGLGVEVDPKALKRHARRFYSVTPVRFVVSSARRAGLKQTAELAQSRRRRGPRTAAASD